jgi:hypothetical protein
MWAASPAIITLLTANLLQLRAENSNGLDRIMLMQSNGNCISWPVNLVAIRTLHENIYNRNLAYPYFDPASVK